MFHSAEGKDRTEGGKGIEVERERRKQKEHYFMSQLIKTVTAKRKKNQEYFMN